MEPVEGWELGGPARSVTGPQTTIDSRFNRFAVMVTPTFDVARKKLRDRVLRGDIALRIGLRKLFPKGVLKNKHFYDKK